MINAVFQSAPAEAFIKADGSAMRDREARELPELGLELYQLWMSVSHPIYSMEW